MEIIYISILTFIATFVGTLVGFGTSTIMIPVLVLFFSIPQTLFFVGIIHWISSLWKMLLFRDGIQWKLLVAFGIPGIIMSYIGASITLNISQNTMQRILGIFLIIYTIFLLHNQSFKVSKKVSTAILGGSISGFLAGIFGIRGAIRSAFLTAFDLPKSVYIATTGAIAFLIDSTRLITYFNGGTRIDSYIVWGFLIFIPLSFIGAYSAKLLVNKISHNQFRMVITIFLFFMGIKLIF